MGANEYILSKQIQWAKNHDIQLVGSKGERGRPTYTTNLNQNLFEPLSKSVRESFMRGDGNEIKSNAGNPAKMQAVHSSSALAVNIFQYWQNIGKASEIAAACELCRSENKIAEEIVFEEKYSIDDKFQFSPNIDVVFHNSDSTKFKRFAVECKFSETYNSRGHSGLKPEYMTLNAMWQDIPNTYELSKSISPNDSRNIYLHAAQLIKHILGLKRQFGKNGFRLLYLWYDVPGKESAIHREEIDSFSKIVKDDDIKFHSISYQELIMYLADKYRQDHEAYIRYLTERYL
jgi:hypothetical protein